MGCAGPRSAPILLAAVLAAACSPVLEDTVGARAVYHCDATGCSLGYEDGASHGCILNFRWLVAGGALASLCTTIFTYDTFYAGTCRPIVCRADRDCPVATEEGATYACDDGLCRDRTAPLTWWDVVSLCLADIPRDPLCPASLPDEAEARVRLALAACEQPELCELPAECAR